MKRALVIGLCVVGALAYVAAPLRAGQGWQDDQYADPYHLFYVAGSGPGIAWYQSSTDMLTSDAANLFWSPTLYQARIRNPNTGNVFAAWTIMTRTGGPGVELAMNQDTWSAANEDPNGGELVNAAGASLQFYGGTVSNRGSAYMEGQTIAAGAYPSTGFGAQLGTTDTHGFLYIPSTNGIPTGVPAGLPWQYAGTKAIVYDSAHGVLYCYNGGWSPCDPSSAGTVTAVTGTPPIFITSTPTTTPNVTIQGAIVSGSTSTTAQNLGALSTAPLGCVTSGGVCTVDGLTLAGGLHFDTGTGTETLASFTCGANTFVSSSSTSGLACTQPAFSDLTGSATCGQLPALTGDTHSAAGTCATVTDHITESSGPTSLAIGSVANNATYDNVLVRGPGVADVHGVTSNLLTVAKQHDWFVNTDITGQSGFVAHNSNGMSGVTPTLYPGDHVVQTVFLQVLVIGNTLTGGSMVFQAEGGTIAGYSTICTITITSGSGTGLFGCTGSTGSSSAHDQYGLFVDALTATGIGAGLVWSATETWE